MTYINCEELKEITPTDILYFWTPGQTAATIKSLVHRIEELEAELKEARCQFDKNVIHSHEMFNQVVTIAMNGGLTPETYPIKK